MRKTPEERDLVVDEILPEGYRSLDLGESAVEIDVRRRKHVY